MIKRIALVGFVFVLGWIGLPARAWAPVEYVKICSLYPGVYYYLPGTNICVNPVTYDARQTTDGGPWRWRIPNNPQTWSASPRDACKGGRLVTFGTITGAGLALNDYTRWETTAQYLPNLRRGQYIGSVLYRGGFTGVGRGNFCMYYSYYDPDQGQLYLPLGCIDTLSQVNVPATLAFAPDRPTPPNVDSYIVGANGEEWDIASADDIGGALSVWLCVMDAR